MNWKLICLFFLIVSCKENTEKKFIISGKIKGDSPDYIYLNYGNIKDSCFVNEGKFSFTGKVAFPISAEFTIIPLSTIDKVFHIENTEININISIEKKTYKNMNVNFIKIDSVKGTISEKIQSDFKMFEITHKNDKNWNAKLFEKLHNIIEKNPANQYSADLINEFASDSVLSKKQLQLLFKKLDTINQSKFIIESLIKKIYPEKELKVGDKIFDFELSNQKGILVNTKKYRGKLLLIDFWASWCMPCRKQHPEFIKIYSNFKGNGFEILGVSIDTNKEKWLKAIEKDNLIWENVIDTKGKESKFLVKYNAATSIPRNFLIGKDGEILKIDISLEDLNEFLTNQIKVLN